MGIKFHPSQLLERPLMANVASVAADGTPRNAPMWYIWEENAIWLLGSSSSSSIKRLKIKPNCAVEIIDFNREDGILLHLGLRGVATIMPMDRKSLSTSAQKYVENPENWNAWFTNTVAKIDDPAGRLIRLKPDTTFTNNVSYFKTGPELAWPEK
jgi:general stress protein 26